MINVKVIYFQAEIKNFNSQKTTTYKNKHQNNPITTKEIESAVKKYQFLVFLIPDSDDFTNILYQNLKKNSANLTKNVPEKWKKLRPAKPSYQTKQKHYKKGHLSHS